MALRATILLLSVFCATATAQTRMSVADVESLLSSHIHGDELASRLTSMELAERVTPARLAGWQADLKDSKARTALQAIADLSAFRPAPPADISPAPSPDKATQLAILDRATAYTRGMRPRLPNFLAVRATTRFEFAAPDDLKQEEQALQLAQMSRARLHYTPLAVISHQLLIFLMGSSHSTVTYRDGAEISTPEPDAHGGLRLADPGLVSSGEFGSILAVVDKDAAAGAITWDHWEQGAGKLLGVFRYSVPKAKSHFALYSPPVIQGMPPEKHTPAYHGEIAIDPDNGSVYRITLLADSDPPVPDILSGVSVEYGSINMGGASYVCPVHAVAVMTLPETARNGTPALRRFVNDTTFTGYHVFRSDSRVIPDKTK
jgi:hypothetical protein